MDNSKGCHFRFSFTQTYTLSLSLALPSPLYLYPPLFCVHGCFSLFLCFYLFCSLFPTLSVFACLFFSLSLSLPLSLSLFLSENHECVIIARVTGCSCYLILWFSQNLHEANKSFGQLGSLELASCSSLAVVRCFENLPSDHFVRLWGQLAFCSSIASVRCFENWPPDHLLPLWSALRIGLLITCCLCEVLWRMFWTERPSLHRVKMTGAWFVCNLIHLRPVSFQSRMANRSASKEGTP